MIPTRHRHCEGRWRGAVSLEFGPDGRRIRRKVSGKTKAAVQDRLRTVCKAGYQTLTTHVFVADSPYLDSDAVFAVRAGLVVEFAESTDPGEAARSKVTAPFRHAHFAIRLTRGDQ